MWDKLKKVHGGEKYVLREKYESFRGKFYDIKMKEGEKIAHYYSWIKEVVNSSRGCDGKIEDETMINKVLRTLLPIYAIRVFAKQESRCTIGNDLILDSLIGRLFAYELSNFDNFSAPTIKYSFKSQLVLHKSKKKKGKYDESEWIIWWWSWSTNG